jgi:myosin protein heavy chain
MEAKTSEESRRGEVAKQKEAELQDLRQQAGQLQQELSEARRTAIDAQNKLKIDLESSVREHNSLLKSHRSLSDRVQANDRRLKETGATLAEVEKTKRSQESELQELRSRRIDTDGLLAELQKAKEVIGHTSDAGSAMLKRVSRA